MSIAHFFGGPLDGAVIEREDAPMMIFAPQVVEASFTAPLDSISWVDLAYRRRGPELAGHAYYDYDVQTVIIARHLIDQMIAHAQTEAPLECCGIIATQDGEAVRLYPAMNAAESEYRYEINGVEQMVIASDIEDEGLEIGGIYHSHTHAPPIPSLTDVVSAAYPDAIYVILGRFSTIQAEPVARAYRINGSAWTEEPLDIRG